jgi:hypothetical protein
MPAPKRRLSAQMSDNQDRRCEHARCDRSRFKFSRWCRLHSENYFRNGHSDAVTAVGRDQWGPFVSSAHAFLTTQIRAGHPGVEDAIRWLASEMVGPGAVARRSGPRCQRGYQAALDRCKGHGVEPLDLLARVVAADLGDDRGDAARPMFLSDDHQRHQFARLFLYAVPHHQGGFAKRRRDPAPSIGRRVSVSFQVRQFAHARVHGALGLLASYAAAEIRRRIANDTSPPNPQHGPVTGSAAPFNAT